MINCKISLPQATLHTPEIYLHLVPWFSEQTREKQKPFRANKTKGLRKRWEILASHMSKLMRKQQSITKHKRPVILYLSNADDELAEPGGIRSLSLEPISHRFTESFQGQSS